MGIARTFIAPASLLALTLLGGGAQAQSMSMAYVEPDPIFADQGPGAANTPNAPMQRDMPPVFGEWSGVYVGLNSGWGWGDISDADIFGDLKPNGGLAGFQIGYNYQTGMIVFGIEADYDFARFTDTRAGFFSGTAFGLPASGFFVAKGDLNSLGTLRTRFGVDVDHTLLYVTAGMAYGEQKISAAGVGTIGPYVFGTAGESTQTHVGWTVGIGGEVLLTRTVSVRAEYLYVDLGSETYFDSTFAQTEISNTDSVVRVAINYKP